MNKLNKTTIESNDDNQTKVDITNGLDKKLLATILFADIQGYSLIMNKEESRGLLMVKKFKSLANELVTKHGGAIVKDMGDGYIALFTGIEGAMAYGLEYQYAMLAEQIPVRIGIHSGDVTINKNEVYGNGVNLAARIESSAKAGGVYFSKLIADNIASNSDYKIVDLGNFELKNFPNPVRLFALDHEGFSHHKNSSDGTQKTGFFERLFWVPKEKRSNQMVTALSGAALYGAVSFLYGCNDADVANPSIDPEEECGGVTNHLNEALLQLGDLAESVTDDMSFNDAFTAARDEVGAGGIFAWHGQVYNTYTRSEYEALSSTEQNTQIEKIEEVVIQHETVTNEPLDVQETLKMESVNLDDDLNVEALIFKDGDQIVKLEIDSDGNGSFDLTIADTNGDGQLDTIGRLTIDGTLNSAEALSEPITPDAFLDHMRTEADGFDVFALTQSEEEDIVVEATEGNFDHHIDNDQIISDNELANQEEVIITVPDDIVDPSLDIVTDTNMESNSGSDEVVEENVVLTEDSLNSPPEAILDNELNPIGPEEETPVYDEAIYNEDIPGMTSNDNVDDWDGVIDATSDEQITEAYQPEMPQIMNDPAVVDMNDSNMDGTPDEFLLDANQDGYPETIALDHNQNGIPEEYIIDTDMDGEADTLASDFDEDGTIDEIL